MTHTNAVNLELVELSKIPQVRVWKQQTGVARSMDDPDRIISFGIKGSGDISGIVTVKCGLGVRLEIDKKIGKDKMSDDQIKFAAMITARGGLYIESRNTNETIDIIKKFIESH